MENSRQEWKGGDTNSSSTVTVAWTWGGAVRQTQANGGQLDRTYSERKEKNKCYLILLLGIDPTLYVQT